MEAVARASIYDVAERAGVSPSTVSRSLQGKSRVAPETRRRVAEAAEALSYVASPQASGLATGRTGAVGVVVPFVSRWFFGTLVAGVTDVLRDAGHDVLLHHLGDSAARDRFFARMPLARRVDAVVTCSMPLTEEHTLGLRALGVPHVSIGAPLPGHPTVGIDEAGAVAAAVNHLVHQGHTDIGYLAGLPDDPAFGFTSSLQRRAGYERAMAAAGLGVDARWSGAGPHGVAGGLRAMAGLLSGTSLPTAVVAEYDELAFGALLALRRAGLRVPEDVSLVGVDDHDMAEVVDLTTVGQDVRRQGEVAARLVLDLLGEEGGSGGGADRVRVLPSALTLRGTTAPPRAERRRAARR